MLRYKPEHLMTDKERENMKKKLEMEQYVNAGKGRSVKI